MISNATGDRQTALLDGNGIGAYAWSPDGQWIALLRDGDGKVELTKGKPVPGATAIPLTNATPAPRSRDVRPMLQWSPAGDFIAYPSVEGVALISPDGKTARKLNAHNLKVFGFSKDGSQLYGVFQNTTGEGPQWQLYSIDVTTGAERMLAPIDLPASANAIVGFSLHPDGRRFLTSIAKWPFDIWMLEGWEQPQQKTWLDRLLQR
jgi:Tol biopolymer transport system component